MNIRKKIKKDGLYSLKRKWAFPIFMLLLFVAIYLVFAYALNLLNFLLLEFKIFNYNVVIFNTKLDLNEVIFTISSYVLNFLSLLIFLPLSVGMTRWYVKNIKDENPQNKDFYYYFNKKLFFKTFAMKFLIRIKIILWSVLFTFPGIFCLSLSNQCLYFDQTITNTASKKINNIITSMQIPLIIIGIILLVLGIVAVLLVSYRYFFCDYLLIAYPDLKISKINQASIYYAKNNYMNLFKFQISFLPLLLLSLLVIPALFVFPYFQSSIGIYAQYIIFLKDENYKKNIMIKSN
ncbi:MAG: DUF975 family protein [Oscillospiraceae bacterium]